VPGTDGEKMSKSYDNIIGIFEEEKPQKKKIMRIQTDSRPMEDPKDPESDHLFQLFRLLAPQEQIDEMADLYRKGGFGYGHVKKAIAEAAAEYFGEARERRRELEAKPEQVREVLAAGAARARETASDVLARVESACGIRAPKAT
jgi:tryptophanyl-tRNA synthetase